jgi:putative membrane protein
MGFVDDLGFIVAIILAAAGVFTYASLKALLAIYRNDPQGLRRILKSSAVPIGLLGAVNGSIGLAIEILWPFPGSYNIFFGDVVMLFSLVMIVYAIVAWFGLKLEYAGLFGAIAGVTVAWYGYWGYTTLVKPNEWGLTKDPLETFLMYLAFAAASFFAFPATLAVDWFLEHPGPTWTPFTLALKPSKKAPEEAKDGTWKLPMSFWALTIWFPIFSFLALIAAWLYLGGILPGHLTSPP